MGISDPHDARRRDAALRACEEAAAAALAADARLRGAVDHARALGVSWQAVADSLGVTRQAAWERYRVEAPDPLDQCPPAVASA